MGIQMDKETASTVNYLSSQEHICSKMYKKKKRHSKSGLLIAFDFNFFFHFILMQFIFW